MKVVDENDSIRAIEEKINAGVIEEVIYQAHNELKLLRYMKAWNIWDKLQEGMSDENKKLFEAELIGTNEE